MKFLKTMLGKLLPHPMRESFRNFRYLSIHFGQYKSIRKKECIDKNNQPIPWYTYPAIEYIKQLDFSDKTVFEYGSGNSSIFWSQRCSKLVAIEDNPFWFKKIQPSLAENVEYRLCENKKDYINAISSFEGNFDVIIIDGSHRLECAEVAVQKLSESGFIILDNSDWREQTSKLLRDNNLIEVDMSGFGPINGFTWITSFYLKRSFDFKPAHKHQPVHGIGGQKFFEDSA